MVNVITPAKSEKSTNHEDNSVKRPVRSVRAAVKDKTPAGKLSAGKNHESDKESNDDTAAVYSQNISEVANQEAVDASSATSKSNLSRITF